MDPYVEVAAARRLSILDHTSNICCQKPPGGEERGEKVEGKSLAVDLTMQDLSCVADRQ